MQTEASSLFFVCAKIKISFLDFLWMKNVTLLVCFILFINLSEIIGFNSD